MDFYLESELYTARVLEVRSVARSESCVGPSLWGWGHGNKRGKEEKRCIHFVQSWQQSNVKQNLSPSLTQYLFYFLSLNCRCQRWEQDIYISFFYDWKWIQYTFLMLGVLLYWFPIIRVTTLATMSTPQFNFLFWRTKINKEINKEILCGALSLAV